MPAEVDSIPAAWLQPPSYSTGPFPDMPGHPSSLPGIGHTRIQEPLCLDGRVGSNLSRHLDRVYM